MLVCITTSIISKIIIFMRSIGSDNLELFDAAIELAASYKLGAIEVRHGRVVTTSTHF